ncbi:MAG: glutamate-1-semialdehyde 2,1-aminomutase [Gemmatimonadales bacterium]
MSEPRNIADGRAAAASAALFERARRVIPGGVNSPVRAFGSVEGEPPFVRRAQGAHVWDEDGNEYLDYVGSWGPMILGHAHPVVVEAVRSAAEGGTSFGAPTAAEVRLAEVVVEMVPSVEVVRLVNSGTEATMSAVRLARAVTGSSKVIKFRGGYHGHADTFLVEAGSGAATLGVPSSPGVTAGTVADTLVAEYNDAGSVERLFEANAGDVACVIVEPVAGNMGCVPPREGFLDGVRRLCDAHDALLVFDEVMTGFRVAPGGAQERFGVMPDLTTLGKVLGGGLPVGAYGGREDLMRQVAPDGPVYQAGTLSGNPLATAAGVAVLEYLRDHPEVYDHLESRGRRLDEAWAAVARDEGYSLTWNRVGSMGSVFFTDGPVVDWHSASAADRDAFTRYFWGMLRRGVYLAPSPFEALFLSAAHTEADIDLTVAAVRATLPEVF